MMRCVPKRTPFLGVQSINSAGGFGCGIVIRLCHPLVRQWRHVKSDNTSIATLTIHMYSLSGAVAKVASLSTA
jgi:hypothetical protein